MTVNKLTLPSKENAVQEKINEIIDNLGGSSIANDKLSYYGTCSTAAKTQTKTVDCEGFVLTTGASIRVKFTNAQSYNGQVNLNVNLTGVIPVTSYGTTASVRYCWLAGEVVSFTYDGTNWIMEDSGIATTSYFGITKLYTGATSTSSAYALTPTTINSLSQSMISGAGIYSASATYEVGDRVRYNFQTWVCNTAITTAEAWTEAHWTPLDPLQTQIDNINNAGYITGITSSDVTTALGYTPYNSSNPNGYTSNVGTVTSVNNVLPVNGNVSLTIPSEVTENTVSGWGFTKNVGTVTSVNNTSPDNNGNVTLGIPTVNNATLTIQKNGTDVATFTANSSTNQTANITVPTAISDLTDDTATYPIDKADTLTGLTATVSELNYTDGVISNIQTQLDGKADTSLSNLSSTGQKVIDGQWVYSPLLIADSVNWDNTSSDVSYSLTNYLPNDSYNYEVLVTGFVTTGTTSGQFITIGLYSDIIIDNIVYLCTARTRTTSYNEASGNAIIPVGSGRYVKQYHSNSGNAKGSYTIRLLGYRRIGTNS